MLVDTLRSRQEILSTATLAAKYKGVSKGLNFYYKWLVPGLLVKRWLIISSLGVLLTSLGAFALLKLTHIFDFAVAVYSALAPVTQIIPVYMSGVIAIAIGLYLFSYGQTHAANSVIEVLQPESDRQLIDLLIARRHKHQGAKIVAIGGGTGLSNLLRGLKPYSSNITAIVTVADDGGSSGRLREEIGVLPPGDIRNCIAALAKEENLLTELFQYRFQAGEGLKGHSFGNLFLTAMSEITGDLERAVMASSKVLDVRGRVLPATLSDVHLWAELDTGELVVGESKITETQGQIKQIGCLPANPPGLPAAIKAIEEADCIVIGPGSLYTSIIPNLLVPEIRNAIAKAKVPKIYVCNIMSQPGETEGYSVCDHIEAIDRICRQKLFDTVLVNRSIPSLESLLEYARENSHPVVFDREKVFSSGRQIILADVLQEDRQTKYIRHDFQQLAKVILRHLRHFSIG
ncbi:gluconeogenesis factor YvcK family protein [Myxosarcina sp. GI1]|uniref:gluconeogenesis factor YvcK family protein n=1 Tax=Myxosarcina sp. GI1 TaxID=1541065 RepID=UPI00055EA708|nr:gluconeogenesis factor YvcK family protein [Myxosarcina sp. GI1]